MQCTLYIEESENPDRITDSLPTASGKEEKTSKDVKVKTPTEVEEESGAVGGVGVVRIFPKQTPAKPEKKTAKDKVGHSNMVL